MGTATMDARRVACVTALLADDRAGGTAAAARAAQLAFARLAARHRLVATPVVDLGLIPGWDLAARERAIAEFRASELVVVGSPVLHGGVGGRVKLVLDDLPAGALAGRSAIPVAVGGGDRAARAVVTTLATTLEELGADVLPGVAIADADEPAAAIAAWRAAHLERLAETALVRFAAAPALPEGAPGR